MFKHTDDLTPTLTDCSVSGERLEHHHFLKVAQMIQMYSQDSNRKSVLKTIEIKEAFKEITAGYDHGFNALRRYRKQKMKSLMFCIKSDLIGFKFMDSSSTKALLTAPPCLSLPLLSTWFIPCHFGFTTCSFVFFVVFFPYLLASSSLINTTLKMQ